MYKQNDKYVVVGAGSGVGRNIAFHLAQKGYDLIITSRDSKDIDITASNIMCRFRNVNVIPKVLDLTKTTDVLAFSNELIELYADDLKGVYCTAGYSTNLDDGVSQSPDLINLIVESNYKGIIHLLNPITAFFEKRDFGLISVISSIAVAAPRGRNNIYGSAKAALEYYYRSLQHYFSDTNVNIQIYALGYVDTSLSFGQKLKLPVAKADKVAEEIIKNRNRKIEKVKYLPGGWFFVALILKHLPWFVYKRMKF